jgi:ferrous iron transport protein A
VYDVAPSESNEPCSERFVCPLTQIQPGTTCRIRQVLASPELTQRLREMGFCEEQKVRLLSHERTMICQVCNVRMGINAKLAEAILVEPLSPGGRVR